ncbi:hypothetical protein ACVITL_004546 [Rhizobium pisi]
MISLHSLLIQPLRGDHTLWRHALFLQKSRQQALAALVGAFTVMGALLPQFPYRSINVTVPSHQPVRRQERIMKRFKSARHLQRFVSVHDPIANLFNVSRHNIPSNHHRELRATAIQAWAKSRAFAPTNQSLTPRSCFHSVKFTLPHHQDGSEEELADLESENRHLERLMLVKFREENDRLNSMLRRFGGA